MLADSLPPLETIMTSNSFDSPGGLRRALLGSPPGY